MNGLKTIIAYIKTFLITFNFFNSKGEQLLRHFWSHLLQSKFRKLLVYPKNKKLDKNNQPNFRFESLRKPHLNGLIWIFMSAILITKVIHAQINNRQKWIIEGIIECSEFNSSDSLFAHSLSPFEQNKIWNKNKQSVNYYNPKSAVPLSPEDTFYLKHPLIVTKNTQNHTFSSESHTIDLNVCDSATLEALPRIGPTTASKIIRYRDRLGGYVSVFQLLEIYHIDSLILQIPNVHFHTNNYQKYILKIPRNQISIKDLYRHPYIGKSKANWLWKYLQLHPKLVQNDFNSSPMLTKEEKIRLSPYLNFED